MREREFRHLALLKKLNEADNEPETGNLGNDNVIMGESTDEQNAADVENNGECATSEDEEGEPAGSANSKYGPNSTLLNIDHGANPQFLESV